MGDVGRTDIMARRWYWTGTVTIIYNCMIWNEFSFHTVFMKWVVYFYIPEPLERGYKTHNEFHKYHMKWKFIQILFITCLTCKNARKLQINEFLLPILSPIYTVCFDRHVSKQTKRTYCSYARLHGMFDRAVSAFIPPKQFPLFT